MTHKQKIQKFLEDHKVTIPMSQFVSITSNIYHSYEAAQYDDRHISIDKSKEYWTSVSNTLDEELKSKGNVSVLDFGCGTGFAISQLIGSSLTGKISDAYCYDLSPEMLELCKNRFNSDLRFQFFADDSGLDELLNSGKTFDVIVCNSLLHHILDPSDFFKTINKLLKPEGYFVMGHEPNKLFYNNKILQKATNLFRLQKRIINKLLANKKPLPRNISQLTYNELLSKNIIQKDFPANIIPKFVDIHVPMRTFKEQPWGELGFDSNYINQHSDSTYSVIKQISYNHIKDQEVYASFIWNGISGLLASLFPFDGADSITVYKKNL